LESKSKFEEKPQMRSFIKIGPIALSYADGEADTMMVLVAIRSANMTKEEQKATSDIMTT
jgi:hypothetical protein